jgi:hypothetical protein
MKRCIGFFLVCLLVTGQVRAQETLLREGQSERSAATLTVPFAFYNEASGLSAGFSVGKRGWLQPQATIFATVVGGVEDTLYGFLALRDLNVSWSDRIFVDAQFNVGTFGEIDVYTDGNPDFPDQRAGSHGSDEDNFLTGDGTDNAGWIRVVYVLPIGTGRDEPESRLTLRDGLVTDGGRDTSSWNPLRGGYTALGVEPFFRKQDLSTDEAGDQEISTAGAEFLLHYQNTDFSVNPSRGGLAQVRYTRDWGGWDSTAEWETVDLLVAGYIPLGNRRGSRQRVLALNAWWIDTPSWDDVSVEGGDPIYHRPPSYSGATLGGLSRMKGYPEGRFNDRAAAYYSAEYRHIPEWNPLRGSDWLREMNAHVDWLQYVVGVEIGRVADEFDMDELHSDMNVGGILGVRAMVNHLIVRADVGISDEGAAVQMTIDHPF